MLLEIDAWHIAERLAIAAVLGGLIGWEREQRNKQAGFKTHLLVSVGSALIMLTSIYGFGDLVNHPNARFDPARLAAQVVSGIGFLGAGAILRHSNMIISGLTTAATLWVVAAIGLSVGAGFYFAAVSTTAIVLIIVVFLRGLETKFSATRRLRKLKIFIDDEVGVLHQLNQIIEGEKLEIRKMSLSNLSEEGQPPRIAVNLRIRFSSKKNILNVVERLQQVKGVQEVQYEKIAPK